MNAADDDKRVLEGDFLREETRYLGRVLGQVLRDQVGIDGYDRIERIRQAAVGFRRAEQAAARGVMRTASQRIEDLRAIPWVFSWSLCRLMLPGWYGFGTAVQTWCPTQRCAKPFSGASATNGSAR